MPSDRTPKGSAWTVLGTLQWTTDYFKQHHIAHARAVAEVLLANVLECERIDLYLRYDKPLNELELARFKKQIKRRVNHEPEAYIIGHKEFWSLGFKVTPAVLIPRPETECLVETVLALLHDKKDARILELGTGSGAISVALASEKPGWRHWAIDISWPAIELARHNARHLLGQDRIHFVAGSWLDSICCHGERFDAIISNPPYIATADMKALDPEITKFEPLNALDGGPQGLDGLERIIGSAPNHLVPGGYLILEMGYDQRTGVERLAKKANAYGQIEFSTDYSGLDRVAQLRKENK